MDPQRSTVIGNRFVSIFEFLGYMKKGLLFHNE